MPNIEIHGIGEHRDQDLLRSKIFAATEKLAFARATVVTIVPDKCVDRNCVPRPFLRIVSYVPRRTEQLVEVLKLLNMDMETPDEFIPGMQS